MGKGPQLCTTHRHVCSHPCSQQRSLPTTTTRAQTASQTTTLAHAKAWCSGNPHWGGTSDGATSDATTDHAITHGTTHGQPTSDAHQRPAQYTFSGVDIADAIAADVLLAAGCAAQHDGHGSRPYNCWSTPHSSSNCGASTSSTS